MSFLFRGMGAFDDGSGYPSPLAAGRAARFIGRRGAMRHSAMWASVRLRSDLISTLPVDVYTKTGSVQVEVPTPPVLVNPGGERVDVVEWLYSSQSDLDICGNTFGLITERDAFDLPARIDLVPREQVVVRVENNVISYLIAGTPYKEHEVWHERQYTSSGLVVGLSPMAAAAMSLYQYTSAQEFAVDWFAGGAIPTGHLKYGQAAVPAKEAEAIKARFRLAVENGDVFVHGKDWDYSVIQAQGNQSSFLETMKATDTDITRFMGVPADLIDAQTPGGTVTYANITQRNLQLLVMNLGPAIIRREKALSKIVHGNRFVKLNSAALLRMDPETVAKMLGQQVRDRLITPTEARGLDNREPFTPAQIEEFKILWPDKPTSTDPQNRGIEA